MSITPSPVPRPEQEPSAEKETTTSQIGGGDSVSQRPMILLAVLILIGLGGVFYYSYQLNNRLLETKSGFDSALSAQRTILQGLNDRMNQADERYADLQGEFAVTKDRLGLTQSELRRARKISSELARQQKESAAQLTSQLGNLQQEQVATKGSVGTLSTDVVEVKEDVKATQEQLASTRTELQRVKGDLGVQSDLIAHNRGELSQLRQLGERDYFEFDLRKTRRPQRVGSIALRLRKTDVKRQKYTIYLVADDRTIEKKDKTVHEPVQFYRPGERFPTEIVVNQIFKNRIVGYVSSPKKKKEQRTPMEASS